MEILGAGTKDTNLVFRLLLIGIAAIAAFAVIVSWRAQVFVNAQYQEFPRSHKVMSELVAVSEVEREKQH